MSENMPQTLADVKAGDEVVMIYRTGRMTAGRSDDRVVRAVVTDAKRVNLTIVEQNVQQPRKWTIRRDTGTEKTPEQTRYYGGSIYGWKAYTVAQREHDERRSAAYRTLRRHRNASRLWPCWPMAHAVTRERDRGWPGAWPSWRYLCSDIERDRPSDLR